MAIPPGTRFLHFELFESNATIPVSGVFFDTASVVLEDCQRLADNSFDSGSAPLQPFFRGPSDPPWTPGQWNAENANLIVGPVSGVSPFFGDGMLRVNQSFSTSQVSQIIDVQDFAQAIDGGGVSARFSSWFNAAEAGGTPRVFLQAGESQISNGTLVPVGGSAINGFNQLLIPATADGNPMLWEAVGSTFALPAGTRFLRYELSSPGATQPPSGMFFDEAQVCLKSTLPSFGLPNTALGGAQLGVDASTGALTVANIGASGLDGVSVQGPPGADIPITMPFDLASYPMGGQTMTEMIAVVDGNEQVVGRSTLTRNATAFVFAPDYSPAGSADFTVRGFDGGTLVFEQAGIANGSGIEVMPSFTNAIKMKSKKCKDVNGNKYRKTVWGATGGLFSVSVQGSNFSASTIEIDPISVAQNSTFELSRVQITAANLPVLSIDGEAVGAFQSEMRAQGLTRFGGSVSDAPGESPLLFVSNIGSSGEDGVAISVDTQTHDVIAELGPANAIDLSQPGQSLTLNATGVFGGVPATQLGTATFTSDGASIDVTADFTSLSSPNADVRVFNDGVFVGNAVVPAGGGSVGTLTPVGGGSPCPIIGCGKLQSPGQPPCFVGNWPLSQDFTYTSPLGGAPLVGDEVRILATDATAVVDDIDELILTGTNLGSFAITGVASTPPCPSDLNNDGLVNGADISVVLNVFGASGAGLPADLNGDGVVNGGDISFILNAFGPCP